MRLFLSEYHFLECEMSKSLNGVQMVFASVFLTSCSQVPSISDEDAYKVPEAVALEGDAVGSPTARETPTARIAGAETQASSLADESYFSRLSACLQSEKTPLSHMDYQQNRPDDYYELCIASSDICVGVQELLNNYEPERYAAYKFPFVMRDVPGSVLPKLAGRRSGGDVYGAKVDLYHNGNAVAVYWVPESLGVMSSGIFTSFDTSIAANNDPLPEFDKHVAELAAPALPRSLAKYVWRYTDGIKWVGSTLLEYAGIYYLAVVSPSTEDQPTLLTVIELQAPERGDVVCQFTSNYSIERD